MNGSMRCQADGSCDSIATHISPEGNGYCAAHAHDFRCECGWEGDACPFFGCGDWHTTMTYEQFTVFRHLPGVDE